MSIDGSWGFLLDIMVVGLIFVHLCIKLLKCLCIQMARGSGYTCGFWSSSHLTHWSPAKCEIRDSIVWKTLRNAMKRSAEPVQEFRGRKNNVTSNTVCFSSPSLAACPEDLQQGWLVGRKQSWQVHRLINDKSKIRVVYFRCFFGWPTHCWSVMKEMGLGLLPTLRVINVISDQHPEYLILR